MARPAKSLLKDSHPELAKQLVDQSLLPTLSTGAEKKVEWRCDKGHIFEAKVYNRTNAKNQTGCPYCSSKKILVGFNDLATTDPEVAAMLVDVDPTTVMRTSSGKHTFRCSEGHEWDAPLSRLTFQGSRCPYCSGRLAVENKTDLASTHPELAKQLVDQSLAHKLTQGSMKMVNWKCDNGHEWSARVQDRILKKAGCPYCSGRNIIVGVNDFATLYPDLAKTLVNSEDGHRIGKASEIKVGWRCEKYPEHIWYTAPYNRINHGCAICDGKQVLEGFNDLATTNPDIINMLVDKSVAKTIMAGSGKKVMWRCEKGHEWLAAPYNVVKAGIGCPICNPTGTSKAEKDLYDIVKKLVYPCKVINKDTSILPGRMELDIVVPEKRIAIEFNGTRWHCELTEKSNNYHKEKSDLCKKAGYQLIHIWEDDWNDNKDIVIRMLSVKLGAFNNLAEVMPMANPKMFDRVYARKLMPKQISGQEAKAFLNNNHIQGNVTATYHFALFEGNIMRAIISLRSPDNNARMKRTEGEWEIQRYATYGMVVGGFSKLLAYAQKVLIEDGKTLTRWISFSSNDISDGKMYQSTGFVKDKELYPDYRYVGDMTDWRRRPKEMFQKKRLKANPNIKYTDGMTEHEICLANKLYRIYDAGKVRWIKDIKCKPEDLS